MPHCWLNYTTFRRDIKRLNLSKFSLSLWKYSKQTSGKILKYVSLLQQQIYGTGAESTHKIMTIYMLYFDWE